MIIDILLAGFGRLFTGKFRNRWEKELDSIRLLSPGDLEALDSHIKKLERLYEFSGMRQIVPSLEISPSLEPDQDDYHSTLKDQKRSLCESIHTKFRNMESRAETLLSDFSEVSEYEEDKRRFDEALSHFHMMRAFFSRWKLDTDKYRYVGSSYDYSEALKRIGYRLARKRMALMREYMKMKRVVDYRQKLSVLEDISGEVTRMLDWYKKNFLNQDSRNTSWIGKETSSKDTPWTPVDFLMQDTGAIPFERFRKVPGDAELSEMQQLFDSFVEFYSKNGIVPGEHAAILSDYSRFREYMSNFSPYSENSDERLTAALLDQMRALQDVLWDAEGRVSMKKKTEESLETSFSMYFAPIDEIYEILKRGYISSEHSIHHKVSGDNFDNLVFSMDSEIRDGDIGFIFPTTRILDGYRFYQASRGDFLRLGVPVAGSDLHVFSHSAEMPLRIDIRLGIFVAPKNRLMKCGDGRGDETISCEEYFKRFFRWLAESGSDWFDGKRTDSWLSRHCIFYDEKTRIDILGMLRDRHFVSTMNRFSNKQFDNLALSQVPGKLRPTGYYVEHSMGPGMLETVPSAPGDSHGAAHDASDPDKVFNVTLFEWERKEPKVKRFLFRTS